MSPAQEEREGDTLTVLTVRQDEISLRGFHVDCRGETSCRAELGDLLQLLERRRADVAIFLAHPNLVGSLIEELRRRGKDVPEILIAPPTDAGEPRVTVSVSLSGLSESAHPLELLARLYEALCAAQGVAPAPLAMAAEDAPAARQEEVWSQTPSGAEKKTGVEDVETETAAPDADAERQPHMGAAAPVEATAAQNAQEAPAPDSVGGADAEQGRDATSPRTELDELSARLARILEHRLR